jgi:Bacterial regulatory helix-turn-helix protein, lysR family
MPRPSRLSLELLETFVALVEHDGDATHTAEQLGINQPSVSKRLAALRRLTAERIGQPWLMRKGKRWRLTPEGQRVRIVVADMVRRYQELERFVSSGAEGGPLVSIACGHTSGYQRLADERALKESLRGSSISPSFRIVHAPSAKSHGGRCSSSSSLMITLSSPPIPL